MLNSVDDIKHAINRLPPRDRYRITAWLFGASDEIYEATTSCVAEPRPPTHTTIPQQRHMSVEEYLEFEKTSSVRHEFITGQLFPMTEVSTKHNHIVDNLFHAFTGHMQGGPCMAFMTEVMIGLGNNGPYIYYYPDLVVTCDRQNIDEYCVRNPKLIVEVFCPSTEIIDRREKVFGYRRIESLEEYVVVAQNRCEVAFYRRDGEWEPEFIFTPEAVAEFRSIGLSMAMGRIYEGV